MSGDPAPVDHPQGAGATPMGWGSDAIAALLRRLDLGWVALNPGASYRGLHDSLVNYLGNRDPALLLTLHEESAVAIAHGYAKVAERPMAVVLHSNVGLMHGTMAIFNLWCDRVPALVLGATGPVDAARRRPWIDWIHTAQDQGALVRHYTKWDNQPASIPAALEALLRANQLMRTAPRGPVYVCLDAALQEAPLAEPVEIPDPARFQPGPPPAPDPDAVRRAAEWLAGARHPAVLAGRVSRRADDWERRVRLAEALGARVLTDLKVGAAFPTRHPLHAGAPGYFLSDAGRAALAEADVVLSLDWVDLAGTLRQARGTDPGPARVVHGSLDSYVANGWSMDHQGLPPADLPVLCEPDALVAALLAQLGPRGMRVAAAPAPPPATPALRADGPIGLRDLAAGLAEAFADRPACLIRLPLGWPGDTCAFAGPLDYLGSEGGAGLGAGPGMAVGAALALRGSGRLPVAVLGDGDYLMGVTALWTAAHYRIPLLVVVANNRSYYNDEMHQERVARSRGRPVENKWIGQRLDEPAIDLAAMARAQGLEADGPVSDLRELPKALARAIAAVEGGQPYVLDVVVPPGYAGEVLGAAVQRR
jgi:thiamine pyrophosphate-dependent acetolactate synthase large subunit-like protein